MNENRPIWPMVWPWKDGQGRTLKWRDALYSRQFSLSYLSVISLLYVWLGLGTSSCSTSSEIIICDFAMWPYNLLEAPHVFLVSVFTSIWFHNSPDHILLVVIVIVLFLQSAEVRIGRKRALIAMFGVQLSAALVMTIYLYMGTHFHPEDDWYHYGIYGRNYMGGSVGLFGVVGVLFTRIKRPIFGAMCYFAFEYWNAFIYHGASMYVVTGHATAFSLGLLLGIYWLRTDMRNFVSPLIEEE